MGMRSGLRDVRAVNLLSSPRLQKQKQTKKKKTKPKKHEEKKGQKRECKFTAVQPSPVSTNTRPYSVSRNFRYIFLNGFSTLPYNEDGFKRRFIDGYAILLI